MLAVWVGALQIVLDKGEQEDWLGSRFISSLVAISALMAILFVVHELRSRNPVVDLRVFKEPTYAVGVFLMTAVGFVLYGSLVLLPIWMQTLLGYPALQAGIALAPRGFGSFLAMPVVGAILAKFDARKFLAVGLVLASATLFAFSLLNLNAGYWDFFWPQFLQGIGLALLFVPLTTVTMGPISREKMGNATSLFNLLRNLGGSMGIATATTLMLRYQQAYTNILGSHATPYSLQTQQMLQGLQSAFVQRGSDPVTAARQSYAALFGMVERQASILSFLEVFRVLAWIFLLVVPLILMMKRPPTASATPPIH
jgi:DHA2 family multidrug resistance protein